MEQEISKIDAAVHQFGWALRLFLDHKAYIAAITLAGAAEEMLGKVLPEPSAHETLKKMLAAEYKMDENIVSDEYLNHARNWVKHGPQKAGDERIVLDLDEGAKQLILRCLINWSRQPGWDDCDSARDDNKWVQIEAGRFDQWILKNHHNQEKPIGTPIKPI